MADKKSGAYGTGGGGDTDFRKTYDREEYARRAKEREQKEREEGKARYEAKLEGKRYHRRASTPEDVRMLTARESRIDVQSKIGSTQIVKGGAGSFRKSGLGFYCAVCDLSYASSIEWVEHQNSVMHARNAGISLEVQRATPEEVRARLRWLSRKRKEATMAENIDLDARISKHKDEEEKEREAKRQKRREKRRAKNKQDDW